MTVCVIAALRKFNAIFFGRQMERLQNQLAQRAFLERHNVRLVFAALVCFFVVINALVAAILLVGC